MARESPAVAVAVFGVSTPFAYWGFRLVGALVEAVAGRALALHIASLAELREGAGRRDGGSVVMTSDFPDADLARFAAAAGLPVIVFSDAPEVMLDWACESRGLSPGDAARLCSRVCAALAPALAAPRKLVVGPQAAPRELVADILELLWPGQGGRLAERGVAALAEAGRPPAGGRPGEAAELKASLAAYAELPLGRRPAEIVWPLSLFTRPDDRPWRDPFELAGPARALMFGPYMHLPPGDWTARVEFEILGALSGVEATTDVRMNEVVTEKAFVLPAKGMFAYDLGFSVGDAHHPVEIRLFLRKAAIEGVFLPRSVKVRPR